MATDILVLGLVEFTDFAVPEKMPFGGKLAAQVHKLPGGQRVIDTLGPDDMDISWSGKFFGDDTVDMVLTLDGMRRSGLVYGLSYTGVAFPVVITEFVAEWERYPQYAHYRITCTIASVGGDIPAGVDAQMQADITSAKAA